MILLLRAVRSLLCAWITQTQECSTDDGMDASGEHDSVRVPVGHGDSDTRQHRRHLVGGAGLLPLVSERVLNVSHPRRHIAL